MVFKSRESMEGPVRKLVPIGQAAEFLGVSIDTIRRWDDKGTLHSVRPNGKDRYFELSELAKVRNNYQYSISEVAMRLGLSKAVLKQLEGTGELVPEINSAGVRYYTHNQLVQHSSTHGSPHHSKFDQNSQAPASALEEQISKIGDEQLIQKNKLAETKASIGGLVAFKKAVSVTFLSLLAVTILIFMLSTYSFILNPENTAKTLGFRENIPLKTSSKLPSGYQENGQVFGATYPEQNQSFSLLATLLKPISGLALEMVRLLDYSAYLAVIKKEPLRDVNQIFSIVNGEVSTKYNLTFPDTSYLHIPDTDMVKKLNAEYVQGRVPGFENGNLAYYGQGGQIEGLKIDADNLNYNSISDIYLNQISSTNKVAASAIQLSISGGLQNSNGLGLKTNCSNNQVLGWNGSAWVCQDQATGSSLSASDTSHLNLSFAHISDTNNPHNVTSIQVLPNQTGNSGKILSTDGSAVSWIANSAVVAWGAITGTLSDQTDLDLAFNTKEDTLTKGNLSASGAISVSTSRQVIGGDVAISITNAVADGATKGAAAFTAADFDSSAGVISIDYTNGQAASGSANGFLSAANWTTFNSKQNALGFTAVPNTRTINGYALSSNISLVKADISLTNVDDVQQLPLSYLDTDTALTANSDLKVASQKATKTYADTKETAISAGTTLQFFRGDKSWQTLDTLVVPENGSLYFTNTRVDSRVQGQNYTVTGAWTFNTTAPQSSVTPTNGNDLTNKTYVDNIASGIIPQSPVINFYDPTSGLPVGPTLADRYIASATANGWTIHHIYQYNGATWDDSAPTTGWAVYVTGLTANYGYNGSSWVLTSNMPAHNNLSGLQGGTTSQYYHLTSAQYTIMQNTSGANTGDETLATIKTKLGVASAGVDGYISGTDWSTFNSKQTAGNYITALTGEVTASGPGSVAATIANEAVTFAKMQNINSQIILGRNTALSGDVEALSATTVKTILSLNNVENTALSTWAGTSNITTVGAVTGTSFTIGANTLDTSEWAFLDGQNQAVASTSSPTFAIPVASTGLVPDADDGAYLGTSALGFSDLFLASGAVINYANGNAVLTHSTGTLTLGTGTMKISNPTNTSTSVVTIDGTQTLTNKTLTSPNINEAVALTSTSTKLNYLTSAGGTTGTTSTNLVFSTSPSLTTPTLGVASATSINKVAFTAPATGSTLTIAEGKTLTASNTLTLTATDGGALAIGSGGTLGTGAYATIGNYALVGQTMYIGTTAVAINRASAALTLAGLTLTTPTITGGSITLDADTNFVLSGGVNGVSFDTNTLSVDATNHRVGIGTTTPTYLLTTELSSADAYSSAFDTSAVPGYMTALLKNTNASGNAVSIYMVPRASGAGMVALTAIHDSSNRGSFAVALRNGVNAITERFKVDSYGHFTMEGVTSTGATGTGKFVFDTSPVLVTPNIGAATGTSLDLTKNSTTGDQLSVSSGTTGSGGTAGITFKNTVSSVEYTGSITSSWYSTPGMVFTTPRDLAGRGFAFNSNAGATKLFIDTSTGNVGIGTTAPGDLLSVGAYETPFIAASQDKTIGVYGAGAAYFRGRDTTNDIEFIMGASTEGGVFAGAMTAHDYWLRTDNTTRLTIKATTGRIGIGTAGPASQLDVIGADIAISSATTADTTKYGRITTRHYDNTEENILGMMSYSTSTQGVVDIGGGSNFFNAATYLSFYTAADNTTLTGTERARISSAGVLDLGANSLQFGASIGSNDTSLYRSGANALKTDDSFQAVGGYLSSDGTAGATVSCSANKGIKSVTIKNGLITAATCTTNDLTDMAENYGTSDTTIEAGDVVAASSTQDAVEIQTADGPASKAYVEKASSSNAGATIGIISTNPQIKLGENIFSPAENARAVALSGRVKVKVSSENGPIKKGDLVSISSVPGVASKATENSLTTIGTALEDFNGGGGAIIVFVNISYKLGSSQIVQLASTGALTVDSLTVNGDAIFKGVIKGNDKFAGQITIPAGQTEVRVARSWPGIPLSVVVTPAFNGHVWTDTIDKTGFTVKLETAFGVDQSVSWLAIFPN